MAQALPDQPDEREPIEDCRYCNGNGCRFCDEEKAREYREDWRERQGVDE